MVLSTEVQSDIRGEACETALDAAEIRRRVGVRLEKYNRLNPLEQFAMFMGMAQLLELRLKQLLSARLNTNLEDLETWSTGKTVRALSESRLRPDLIELLRSVVQYRNYVAHEYLANVAMLKDLLGVDIGRLELKYFEQAVYELEQVTVLFEWCEENQSW